MNQRHLARLIAELGDEHDDEFTVPQEPSQTDDPEPDCDEGGLPGYRF